MTTQPSKINLLKGPAFIASFLALLAIVMAPAAITEAEQVTASYTGTIDFVSIGFPELTTVAGAKINLDYTYNNQTADSDPDPLRGLYYDPFGTVNVTVGSNVYSATGVKLTVEETQLGDIYSLSQFVSGPLFDGATDAAVGLSFVDPTGRAFSGDSLPASPPLPGEFSAFSMGIGFGHVDDLDPVDDFDLSFGPPTILFPVDDDDVLFTMQDDDDVIRRFDTHSMRTSQVTSVPEPATVVSAAFSILAAAGILIRRRYVS